MCYYHVKANLLKKTKTMPVDVQRELFSDIESLYFCWSPPMFDKASQLFQNKWADREPEFMDYMGAQWLASHKNWFNGFGNIPATDNALESFNGRIKSQVSLHHRMPLNQYLHKIVEATTKWSMTAVYKSVIDIPLALWTSANQWVSAQVKYKKKRLVSGFQYLVPAKMKPYPRADHLYRSQDWSTFSIFKERAFVLYQVNIPDENWKKGTCTCPHYLKHYMCKHLLGISIKNELVAAPLEASQIPIGKRRGPGRPRKVNPALQRD